MKLWQWFVLFSAAIFLALWLLQTVFLQSFYNGMAIRRVKRAAEEMAAHAADADFYDVIDAAAVTNSLLVFVTDGEGNIRYSADEYKRLYDAAEPESHRTENPYSSEETEREGSGRENPWLSGDTVMNWEKGELRNLPYSYEDLMEKLKASGGDSAGFVTEDNAAYVTGLRLEGGDVLYISMPLGTVGGTAGILRMQLLWVSALSLLLGFCLAWGISKRFGKPIAQIADSARQIARGNYRPELPRGFCAELDELSDTLGETALSLEKAENAQREFLANISHDLRTPLTMIRGYAEMVQEISWEDPQERENDLGVIVREADRLTALVNEILDFSALQADTAAKEYGVIDISRAVREVARQFAPFCEKNGFAVETRIEDGLSAAADEAQIKRVMYNFIDNAVNHTDESKRIRVSLARSGCAVRFEATDYGAGIAEGDIPYIWDRYYTARSRKNKETVSGLGLSIAREILTRHNAKFGVGSGAGCTFWFELPQASKERGEEPQ